MPRKSRKSSQAGIQERVMAEGPIPGAPEQPATVSQAANGDRDGQGRFAQGNWLSTGNPHARHCARMLAMFRSAITDEEMYQLCRVLFQMAHKGDMAALKMVWQYKVGKPLPAPNPDMIERDEWNNYQTDAMTPDEMKQVLSRLPSYVGNAIVSTTLPEIAKAFMRDLGKQLLRSMPKGVREEFGESSAEKHREPEENVTVSNGNLAADHGAAGEPSSTREGANVAVSNGDFGPADREAKQPSRSARRASRATPVPATRMPAGMSKEMAESGAEKSDETGQNAAVSNGNFEPADGAASKSPRSTRHAPRPTPSIRKQWIEPIARKVKGRKALSR